MRRPRNAQEGADLQRKHPTPGKPPKNPPQIWLTDKYLRAKWEQVVEPYYQAKVGVHLSRGGMLWHLIRDWEAGLKAAEELALIQAHREAPPPTRGDVGPSRR